MFWKTPIDGKHDAAPQPAYMSVIGGSRLDRSLVEQNQLRGESAMVDCWMRTATQHRAPVCQANRRRQLSKLTTALDTAAYPFGPAVLSVVDSKSGIVSRLIGCCSLLHDDHRLIKVSTTTRHRAIITTGKSLDYHARSIIGNRRFRMTNIPQPEY